MIRLIKALVVSNVLLLLMLTATEAADPKIPEIAGLTVEDRFPRGCVDCHLDMPEAGQDVRISTILDRWYRQVDPEILAIVRAIAPDAVELDGRHPRIPAESFGNIPDSCMSCHVNMAEKVPRLGPMMHAIHFAKRPENHFLILFKGECTYCHKFDRKRGTWSIPSGSEN